MWKRIEEMDRIVRKRSLSDAVGAEVDALTGTIQRDLKALKAEVARLRDFVLNQKAVSRQGREHQSVQVDLLRALVGKAATRVQRALEIRKRNAAALARRRAQLVHNGPSLQLTQPIFARRTAAPPSATGAATTVGAAATAATSPWAARSDPPFPVRHGAAGGAAPPPRVPNPPPRPGAGKAPTTAAVAVPASPWGAPEGGSPWGDAGGSAAGGDVGGAGMRFRPTFDPIVAHTQTLEDEEAARQRLTGVQKVESAIVDLAKLAEQLALNVATQDEVVTRINDAGDETLENMEGAQVELLKYYDYVSSNRAVILMVLAVVAVVGSAVLYMR